MKAAFRSNYGTPEVLSIREVETPVPKDDEVLIRVYAASVNRSDYHVLTGRPFFMRLLTGLFSPRRPGTGCDFAGQVDSVGAGVTHFKAGDRVMGFGGGLGIGSHAEYVTMPETKRIVLMPDELTYEQAAACLEGTYYAAIGVLQLKPSAGQKALVFGATGAIGSAYVQFFRHFQVYVTAVCGGENSELALSWGADRVIDFKTEDFTQDQERYDYVIDAVGKSSFVACKPLMTTHGYYAPSDGMMNLLWVPVTRMIGGKKVLFPRESKDTLTFIRDLVAQGRFKPVIDRVYPLEKIVEAFTYVGTGQKIGNVVVTM